ncbi:hypothetical protein F5X96DRAFT_377821 [Biscogniauxia mediterranea]|nr:hypothetical protein F5X96DRAFT_377821 [Biscogniauxia mediterranea]
MAFSSKNLSTLPAYSSMESCRAAYIEPPSDCFLCRVCSTRTTHLGCSLRSKPKCSSRSCSCPLKMSSALHHQVPINGTIQTIVQPGNKTNLYFILVSNLPWQTSWQQLKDHVRTVCSVERVEVFNDSTSGWVSVRGRENFDLAYRLLNGGVFNGRALFADGKNATEPIMIKELVDTSAVSGSSPRSPRIPRYTTPPSVQYASGTPPMISSNSAVYEEWATTGTNTSACMMTPTVDCAAYTLPMAMPCDYGDATTCYPCDISNGGYFDQTTMMATGMAQYPYQTSYAQQYQTTGEYHQSADYGGTTANAAAAAVVIPTEMRKLIIKQIQPAATYKQVKEFVRHKAGPAADQLQHIDLPLAEGQKASSNIYNRGYALVTFATEDAASRAIHRLHGCEYDGRRLEVEYTKEGVSRNETAAATTTTAAATSSSSSSRGHGHHSSHHSSSSASRHHSHKERRPDKDYHRSHKDKKDKKEQQQQQQQQPQPQSAEKVKSPKSDVIIAHGSSSSKKSDKKKH